MIVAYNEAPGSGRTIYGDGVARSAQIADDLYVLETAGRSVQFDLMSVAEAAQGLCMKAPACRASIVEAAHALVDDVAESIPADG